MGTPRVTLAVLKTYQSKSNPEIVHEVRLGHDYVVYCTCRGWISHKHCRHLDDFKSQPGWKSVEETILSAKEAL